MGGSEAGRGVLLAHSAIRGSFTVQAGGTRQNMASGVVRKRLLSISSSDAGSWLCIADGLSRLRVPSEPPPGSAISQVRDEHLTWVLGLQLGGAEVLPSGRPREHILVPCPSISGGQISLRSFLLWKEVSPRLCANSPFL